MAVDYGKIVWNKICRPQKNTVFINTNPLPLTKTEPDPEEKMNAAQAKLPSC